MSVATKAPPRTSSRTLVVPELRTTEQLLRQRDALPVGHRDRADLRRRAIEQNLPLAGRLARRYSGRGELLVDLGQVAALALVRAVDGYDSSRATPFVGYAMPTIVGAIKRHFRDATWALRVPRSTQELVLQLRDSSVELIQRGATVPTPTELADHLNIAGSDVRAALLAAQSYRPTSLDAPRVNDEGAITDLAHTIGSIDSRYAAVDNHLAISALVATMPARERRILALRFIDEMSQSRIATEVGLSQMHVSRLLRQLLSRLRAELQESDVDGKPAARFTKGRDHADGLLPHQSG